MPGSPVALPEHADTPVSRPRNLALAAVVIAVMWYVCLLSLIVFTDRPVTVNRLQILESHLVVSGSVSDDGTVTVRQTFKGQAPVDNLSLGKQSWCPPGDWILPLVRDARGHELTPTRLPDRARLVYPVSDDVVAQIEEILSGGGRQAE